MISVCIITRDEEEKLNRCLNSLKNYPVEVVVVDTGSKDGTLDMLRKWQEDKSKKFELVIGNFKWCNDFSKARNYAASLAKNDIIFVVDSDDVVEELDLKNVESNMELHPKALGILEIQNKFLMNNQLNIRNDKLPRIYNRQFIKYFGAVHEQLKTNEKSNEKIFAEVKAKVTHDGYMLTGEEYLNKQLRNISLLKKELEKTQTSSDTQYIFYQLGKSYAAINDYDNSIKYYKKFFEFPIDTNNSYTIDALEAYGYSLIGAKKADIALELEKYYDDFKHIADFRNLMGLIYLNNHMFVKALSEFLGATMECKVCRTEGANSFLAFYYAAGVNELLGNIDGALMLYKQCGDYEPAKNKIKELEKRKN